MKDDTDYETTVGNDDLSAWASGETKTWIQSRRPDLSRKLERLDGARVVAVGVGGGDTCEPTKCLIPFHG